MIDIRVKFVALGIADINFRIADMTSVTPDAVYVKP